jgi:transcriptional regulator, XRE family
MRKTYKSDALAAIHETASDLHEVGLISRQTMKRFDENCLTPITKLSPQEIKSIRENSLASQTVFARYLNVTPGLVSQWERGEKSPSGASLKLLTLVQKKGLESIA